MIGDVVKALAGAPPELRERYLARIRQADGERAREIERSVQEIAEANERRKNLTR